MTQIRRPTVVLPAAPATYDQREQNEFRRIVMQALGESVEDVVRPSLEVTVTPGALQYTVVVTYTGTMTYQINAGGAIAGTTSPQTLTIDRNADPGPAIVYVFSCTRNGQTLTNTVTIPAAPASAEPSLFIGGQSADDTTDTYTYTWTANDMPMGTTFSLEYILQDTLGTEGGYLTGTVDPAVSGGTIVSPSDIGPSPTFDFTVRAWNGGNQVAYAREIGTFTT